eukprot:TRINITY_DN356_c0_g1_i3.p2 TRINITY_DN356_c0_g1~~TRINITY_DN356_c0_g1_i3.p2  ORF type:complete len:131 (-),score=23.61 TRINITY_DN356_c0_g1_i3:1075-1467(-)
MIRSTCRGFKGAVEALQVVREQRTLAAEAAASITLIQWAVRTGLRPELAQKSCIRYGNLVDLRQLQSMFDLPLVEQHCTLAAAGELLQWLRQHGCTWCEWTCAQAARGGHLELLQWARADGCPWKAYTYS